MGVQDWHFAGWSERANASVPNYLPSASFYLTRNMELYTVFTQPPAVPPSQGESVRFTVQTGAHTKYMSGVNDGPFHPLLSVITLNAFQTDFLFRLIAPA